MASETTDGRKAAALMLMASGVLIVVLMGHHPTGADSTALMRGVHGAILLVMLVLTMGFALAVRWRPTPLAVAGLVPFVAGMLGGVGAGTINGFIVPSLVEQGETAFRDLLWTANQQLAVMGVVATGIAYTLWAVDWWTRGWRATALAGAMAGLVPAFLLISGNMEMGLGGALFAYAANALWASWLGLMLWRADS